MIKSDEKDFKKKTTQEPVLQAVKGHNFWCR